MNSDDRIIELLSDILVEQKGMRADISEMKNDISQLKEQQIITNNRLEKLEDQQAKTNIAIGELRLSVMKLAERLEIIADHEKRIDRLEHTVYNS
jgi:uncharacterized coiled-coil protein SlyX